MKYDQKNKPNLPRSSGFWILATGYRDAGDAVDSLVQPGPYVGFAIFPCIFLYFRSIELALKSVLVFYAVPEKEITKCLGHRLSALIDRLESFTELSEIGIAIQDRRLIDRFSEKYSDKWFEYPDNFWDAIPERENLKNLAHRVCEKVKIHIKKPNSE